ncbi:hypothetical protein [Marinifilum flexuosum]|uniref:HEPN domain-containing protein n=1 Tax=Marinifilum flexuosum TaxID=1117708 RepID=A0A419X4A4_9BACT|nr:hypothetical protein [Marinifilum flexuosum]RKE02449.1 hypothetical protein BXY64_2539 [Marinifilum flexuosum]
MEKVKIIDKAKEFVYSEVLNDNVNSAVIWGSVSESEKEIIDEKFDVDILIINKKIEFINKAEMLYGIPSKAFWVDGIKYDLIFVDVPYLENALSQGHWTVFSAIKSGIVLYDNGIFANLKLNAPNFKAFSIQKYNEWSNQAKNLLNKSQILIEQGDFESAIILARHSADAMVQAFLLQCLGKPSSPKSFLTDLKHNAPKEVFFQYLSIHGLLEKQTIDSIKTNLHTIEFITYLTSLIDNK